jgi:transposase-like protein
MLRAVARIEFPKNLKEFRERFADEKACFAYLGQSRWAGGFVCPSCESQRHWLRSRRFIFKCQDCGKQISATAGTSLHGSHFPLREWFWAAYLVATHTPGMSATQLQRQMGCSYKTAWYLLHRLRRAMVNETRSRLSGRVEADEAIIGGSVRGKRGRGVTTAAHSTLIFGAVEVIAYTDKHGGYMEKAGRLRLAVAPRADAGSIRRFLEKSVEPGTEIATDQWRGYSTTALAGYRHELHHPETHALHIHRVFGNLKTWLNGTHHGVDPKYLQNYLDEFVFRFNRRKTPMAAFQTLLGLAAAKPPTSYRKMTLVASTG